MRYEYLFQYTTPDHVVLITVYAVIYELVTSPTHTHTQCECDVTPFDRIFLESSSIHRVPFISSRLILFTRLISILIYLDPSLARRESAYTRQILSVCPYPRDLDEHTGGGCIFCTSSTRVDHLLPRVPLRSQRFALFSSLLRSGRVCSMIIPLTATLEEEIARDGCNGHERRSFGHSRYMRLLILAAHHGNRASSLFLA